MDTAAHGYTLPGGHIVLPIGLLHALRNEAELAGVLAREISPIESAAAMAALEPLVDDTVVFGDILLDTLIIYGKMIRLLPKLNHTTEELALADSLAAVLVCPTNHLHEAIPAAMQWLAAKTSYREARPAGGKWIMLFQDRVFDCIGTDSTYV